MAPASGWNASALKAVFFQSLDEAVKDEMALVDEPDSLDKYIALAVRLDSRLRERRRARSDRVLAQQQQVSPSLHRRRQPWRPATLNQSQCSWGGVGSLQMSDSVSERPTNVSIADPRNTSSRTAPFGPKNSLSVQCMAFCSLAVCLACSLHLNKIN
ncbi:hypothetical protein AMECASPLE_033091 [Ameca splendens]|uniref:Uncharacterized protein n=1 Tax=Ameca splendens TaxID=208324 RepID=A0ABV0Y6Q0_9TELE